MVKMTHFILLANCTWTDVSGGKPVTSIGISVSTAARTRQPFIQLTKQNKYLFLVNSADSPSVTTRSALEERLGLMTKTASCVTVT